MHTFFRAPKEGNLIHVYQDTDQETVQIKDTVRVAICTNKCKRLGR